MLLLRYSQRWAKALVRNSLQWQFAAQTAASMTGPISRHPNFVFLIPNSIMLHIILYGCCTIINFLDFFRNYFIDNFFMI